MAITRAQQARQLYKNGQGPAGGATIGSGSPQSGSPSRDTGSDYGQFDRITERQRKQDLRDLATRQAEDRAEEAVEVFRSRNRENNFNKLLNFVPGIGAARRIASMAGPLNNRDFFLEKIAPKNFNSLPISQQEKMFNKYMNKRSLGEIDAYGNPIDQDNDNNNIIIPDSTMNQGSSTTEQEEDNPFVPYRFMADGGRIGAQQGGIMPRLNELSGDVSSAEQMLQEINQRLQSAESTLGEGGGNTTPIGSGIMQPAFETKKPLFDEDGFRLGDQRYGTGLVDGPKMTVPSLLNQTSEGPIQSPMQDAIKQQFADGGMAEEDDPVGGIMDLESGRQMYFLGKLVKKATRAVKKVVKSPFGKALILGGLTFGIPGVSKGFFSKGLMGTKSGIGLKNLIMGKPLGFKTAGDSVARSGGLLNFIKNNKALSGILGASTLAGLSAPQSTYDAEKEDEFSLNIPEEQYRFYAEGGKAEPVAKKTMPLLDMDGKEKDYRETGGFVDMGRMERADDVPARLSKNEFVFTADAVRNAGEGDIDKGAEVMYNMMKNLEAGGEVSEESQGLDGARNMFQTSQRLEEVL